MIRNYLLKRFPSRLTDATSAASTRRRSPRLEPLEDRQMLSATDLLISTFDDSAGKSVVRYNDITYAPAPGAVATNDHGLFFAQGLAVAPDGTFYVSSLATAQVLHYSNSGVFMDVLGAGDASPAPLFAPGALAFGPNGELYVGELGANAVLAFNTANVGQQWDPVNSLFLTYAPGGFTFAPDVSHDLIVGALQQHTVIRYHSDTTTETLVPGNSGINPSAILARPNGDLLIADFDLGGEPLGHHQIVRYDAGTHALDPVPYINLTTPVGTGGSAGNPPQPTAMLYDLDGNLLVGVSPDHNGNGAVEKFDINDQHMIGTLVSGIGTPTGLAFIPSAGSTIAARKLFYNQSGTTGVNGRYDHNDAAINLFDDAAIATDKTAYLPGSGTATFANVSSYSKGINGIMIDIAGAHGAITAADFIFKVGNDNTPSTWAAAPAPTAVSVRAGAGTGGSDRVEITWANGAIQKQWLEVITLANANTGLAQSGTLPAGQADAFFFGNALADSGIGDTATNATVNATDEIGARNNPATLLANIPITNIYDYNRDAQVNSTDQILARTNGTTPVNVVKFLNIANPPAAPEAAPAATTDLAANSLAATVAQQPAAKPAVAPAPALSGRLSELEAKHEAVARFFEHLAHDAGGRARHILSKVEHVAEVLGLDDLL